MPDKSGKYLSKKRQTAKNILSRCRLVGVAPPWWVVHLLGYKSKKAVL